MSAFLPESRRKNERFRLSLYVCFRPKADIRIILLAVPESHEREA